MGKINPTTISRDFAKYAKNVKKPTVPADFSAKLTSPNRFPSPSIDKQIKPENYAATLATLPTKSAKTINTMSADWAYKLINY